VNVPGSLDATAVDRVFDAINLAGGFSDGASRRSVILERAGGNVQVLDFMKCLIYGILEENPLLHDGDRIHVPAQQGFVRVRGEVNGLEPAATQSPASTQEQFPFPNQELTVEVRGGDRLSTILEMSGGISKNADLSRILVRRNTPEGGDSVFAADLRALYFEGSQSEDPLMQSGDIVDVAVSRDFVYVVGAVMKPGSFPYEANFSARDYIGLAGGPNSNGSEKAFKVMDASGKNRDVEADDPVLPGETIIVSERLIKQMGNILLPLSAVASIIIAIAALQR
jgi:protein involved in polysaccharide export with SLBB domain